MHFLTESESTEWCRGWVELDQRGIPRYPDQEPLYARAPLPSVPELTGFCRALEGALQPRRACLLWVTQPGVWPSSENLHLYYRLRNSYGDFRPLETAPGHLFLDHEAPDLVSFLQIGILCGWDMHLIPREGYARAFVSHDEFVEFTSDPDNTELVREFVHQFPGAEMAGG